MTQAQAVIETIDKLGGKDHGVGSLRGKASKLERY